MEVTGIANSAYLNIQQTQSKKTEEQKTLQEKVEDIKAALEERIKQNALKSVGIQIHVTSSSFTSQNDDASITPEKFEQFLNDIGYEGKSIGELSQEEAAELVSEDGFFGIEKTAKRIADFVIKGANGNETLLRAGREGMLQGFKEAEEIWGGELPEISQKTMKKATELVDAALRELGFSVLDQKA